MKTRPLVLLDLFCGRGGWTRPALARGWECYGFDIKNHGYPGSFVRRSLPAPLELLNFYEPDLILASPPCEEYARHHLPWIHGPAPDESLLRWACTLPGSVPCPVIVECSLFAARHLPGSARCGGYALWGDVPALLPTPPRRKMKHSGTDPAARAIIEPELAEWIIEHFTNTLAVSPQSGHLESSL